MGGLLKSTVLKVLVRQLLHCMQLLKFKKEAELQLTLMLKMLLILLMHRHWALISMNYYCRSLTRENRDLRFVMPWFHPVRLT